MGDKTVIVSSVEEHKQDVAPSKAYEGTVSSHDRPSSTQILVPADNTTTTAPYTHYKSPQQYNYHSHIDPRQHDQVTASHTPFNMSSMTNSLPPQNYYPGFPPMHHQQQQHQHHHHHHQQQQRSSYSQRYLSDANPTVLHSSAPQMAQYNGQPNVNMPTQPFYVQAQSPPPPYFGHQQMPVTQPQAARQSGGTSRPSLTTYHNPVMLNQHAQSPYWYQAQMHPYVNSNHYTHSPMIANHFGGGGIINAGGQSSPSKVAAQQGPNVGRPVSANGTTSGHTNVVRGPPRKPRQSGHAIWIGNLPPQTDLMSLVRHVCAETPALESLFLISKSNCAFANFKDEDSCIAAQQKLHDSKFQTVRLVSRLRKSTVEGSGGQTAPTGPASTSLVVAISKEPDPVKATTPPTTAEDEVDCREIPIEPDHNPLQATDRVHQKDRFFVLKSLTVEDLQLSVRNGVWATQSHNEENLNKAFETADNVYLVFSANKSGEYFGYARMTSPINEDPAAAIKFAPKVQSTNEIDLPKSIPTEATENCPKGRIIDDSSRGTIFWEVDRGDEDNLDDDADSEASYDAEESEGEPKAWGKPFKLEWQSTTKLPFYRTRGLRNVWNSNRDVKIARDGTELETSVGRKLIGLFNRIQSPAPHLQMGFRQGMHPIHGYPPPPPMSPPYR